MASIGLMVTLFLSSTVGAVVWVVSTEAQAIGYGAAGWNPLLIGAVCAGGQNLNYVFLYFGGTRALARWPRLRQTVDRVNNRWGPTMQRAYAPVTLLGALTGVPPILAMVLAAPSLKLHIRYVLTLTLPGRFVRFAVLAWTGERLMTWWHAL